MRNIVGQTPRGEDFFPRTEIIDKVYRRLDNGSNDYLVAPRRAGKTAIMRYLEDNPHPGFEFQYLITESVDNTITHFKMLSESLQRFNKISNKTMNVIGCWIRVEFNNRKMWVI